MFISRYQPKSFVSLPFDVFKGAYIDTLILTAEKNERASVDSDSSVSLVVFPPRHRISSHAEFASFSKVGDYKDWLRTETLEFLITCSKQEADTLHKIRNAPHKLGDFVTVKRGIETFHPTHTPKGMKKPIVAFNGVLQRYKLDLGELSYVDYPSEIEKSKPFPFFASPRILVRQVLSRKLRLQATYTDSTCLTSQAVQSLIQENPSGLFSLRVLVGIINSTALSWYFRNVNSVARRDDFPKIIIAQTRDLPIPAISSQSAALKLDQSVTKIIEMKERVVHAHTAHERNALERQIAAVDRQIDQLVYELYGLTDAEIALVEAATAPAARDVAVENDADDEP